MIENMKSKHPLNFASLIHQQDNAFYNCWVATVAILAIASALYFYGDFSFKR